MTIIRKGKGKENPYVMGNTELNQTKFNKTDHIYIDLPIDDHTFLNIYNELFKRKFKKDHMKVTDEQSDFIKENIAELERYDIDEDTFIYEISVYFKNLPKSNNGNIIAFIHTFPRIFDIQNTKQLNAW